MLKFIIGLILTIVVNWSMIAQELQYGVIYDSVYVTNTDQAYSIYIPSNYSEDKSWPLIFFFDPAARASLPINLYSNLAENYGFIAVCTYNSKNGPFEPGFQSFDIILRHLINTYSIDQYNLITSGFSGGSRIALALAVETKIINGVIACGAGQPAADFLQSAPGDRYSYVSLVGNLDFNYLELLKLDERLDRQKIRNERLIFHGAHQWPPADYFEIAYLWIRSQDNKMLFRQNLKGALANKIDSFLIAENYLQAENLINSLRAINDDSLKLNRLKSKLNEHTYKLQSDKKDWAKAIDKESKIIEELTKKFLEMDKKLYLSMHPSPDSIDFRGWTYYIRKFKRKRDRSESVEAESYQRILSFISANMAERSFTYTRRKLYDVAVKMNEVWLEVDDSNIWANVSMAKLYVIDNKLAKAAIILTKMLETEKISIEQIEGDKSLNKLLSSDLIRKDQ